MGPDNRRDCRSAYTPAHATAARAAATRPSHHTRVRIHTPDVGDEARTAPMTCSPLWIGTSSTSCPASVFETGCPTTWPLSAALRLDGPVPWTSRPAGL